MAYWTSIYGFFFDKMAFDQLDYSIRMAFNEVVGRQYLTKPDTSQSERQACKNDTPR
jgi:hypothetical protein